MLVSIWSYLQQMRVPGRMWHSPINARKDHASKRAKAKRNKRAASTVRKEREGKAERWRKGGAAIIISELCEMKAAHIQGWHHSVCMGEQ